MIRDLLLTVCGVSLGIILLQFVRLLLEPRASKKRGMILYHTAVHEAGHALVVLNSNHVESTLDTVTTVQDGDSSGRVAYSLKGLPAVVQWELAIVALGGAAGEHVGRGKVDPPACKSDLGDALVKAREIAATHKVEPLAVHDTVLNVQSFYKEQLDPFVLGALNICMSEAIRRVRENESDFYRLVNVLLERRELTGLQVKEVLSRSYYERV